MQKKICTPKEQIIQTTYMTTIKQTYSMHIIYTVNNNTTLYTLQQQGQRKPQIQLQIIPFYTYFITIIIIIIIEAVAMTWLIKETLATGLTKPGEVGNFFALVSMKSPNFCQKAKFKSPCQSFQVCIFFTNNHTFSSIFT